jgi:hypothetical protein
MGFWSDLSTVGAVALVVGGFEPAHAMPERFIHNQAEFVVTNAEAGEFRPEAVAKIRRAQRAPVVDVPADNREFLEWLNAL